MTASRIRYILFDLGGTLMRSLENWGPILERADQALTLKLSEYGMALDPHVFRARLYQYYEQRDKDYHETTYHFVLRELLKEQGYADMDESTIRSALDALYVITRTNWALEDDALPLLHLLKSNQYNLGIFSNAGDDQDVQELIDRFSIREYFDFVLTSAACYYRKPHPRAFEIALAQWNIPPEEALMVGDSLEADIQGACDIGMKTIWITRRAQFHEEELRCAAPDFTIPALGDIFSILNEKR